MSNENYHTKKMLRPNEMNLAEMTTDLNNLLEVVDFLIAEGVSKTEAITGDNQKPVEKIRDCFFKLAVSHARCKTT